MFARFVLLGGVWLFLLSPAVAQENSDKPSTNPEPPASQVAVIDVGPGISPPKPTFTPDPDYPSHFAMVNTESRETANPSPFSLLPRLTFGCIETRLG
jgi:hypothetical protein